MIKLIMRLIADALESDFWGEESTLVDAFAEENNGEQLDCEGITITYDADGNVICFIGSKKYEVSIKETEITE